MSLSLSWNEHWTNLILTKKDDEINPKVKANTSENKNNTILN